MNVTSKLMSNLSKNYNVTNRQTFISFLEALHEDFLDNGQAWENRTHEDFLEALTRYTKDIQGFYDNTKQNINTK